MCSDLVRQSKVHRLKIPYLALSEKPLLLHLGYANITQLPVKHTKRNPYNPCEMRRPPTTDEHPQRCRPRKLVLQHKTEPPAQILLDPVVACHCRIHGLTSRIIEPAPKGSKLKRRGCRRVRCIRFVSVYMPTQPLSHEMSDLPRA